MKTGCGSQDDWCKPLSQVESEDGRKKAVCPLGFTTDRNIDATQLVSVY